MKHSVNGVLVDMTPDETIEWQESLNNFVPTTKILLHKTTFVKRMTSSEALIFEEVIQTSDPWLRLLFNSTTVLFTSEALTTCLYFLLRTAFSEERATVLLDPEE